MNLRRMKLNWMSKKYRAARIGALFLACLLVSGLAISISRCSVCDKSPKVRSDSLKFSFSGYPKSLQSLRASKFAHMGVGTYLDYTGAGVYSTDVIEMYEKDLLSDFIPERHRLNSTLRNADDVEKELRKELLDFVSADPEEYTVVFLASATQALKLVGENFPWKEGSKFTYSTFNHNSVLGIRRYAMAKNATFSTVPSPMDEKVADSLVSSDISGASSLFVFPLEDNFAGTKTSKSLLMKLTQKPGPRTRGWFIMGDAAAYLPTNRLNLTETPLDAICLSFYKIIGFPNTGALIIRKEMADMLSKDTYSTYSHQGGLVDDRIPADINVGAIHGLRALKTIGIDNVNKHVWHLTRKLYTAVDSLHHSTGIKAAEVYGLHNLNNPELQGGIVAFNLKRPNGSYIGYSAVVGEASQSGFHLRGGCHCNPGACFQSMRISEAVARDYYSAKTTCGDNNDILDGIPLGSVRASVGWASTDADIDSFTFWLQETFVF